MGAENATLNKERALLHGKLPVYGQKIVQTARLPPCGQQALRVSVKAKKTKHTKKRKRRFSKSPKATPPFSGSG